MSRSTGPAVVLSIYLFLAIIMGVVNPIFEAPDEQWHFFTVQFIADTGALPAVPQPARRAPFVPETAADWLGQEAAQPPLYYALAALAIAPLQTDGQTARQETVFNPFVQLGDASAPANLNGFVHGPAESWPWRGHVLAVHWLRLLSAVLGAGTVWLIYDTGRRLWPDRPRRVLLATALVAFLPQFIFLHSSVTNDVLIIFLATLVLRELVRLFQEQTAGLLWLDYVKLGILCGLAMLTKNQGVILLGFTGLVLLFRPQTSDVRPQALDLTGEEKTTTPQRFCCLRSVVCSLKAAVCGLTSVVLSGWLYWRNWSLYGDPTATNQFITIAGGDRDFTLWQVIQELPGLWLSSFGVFGWFNVRLPDLFYLLWMAVVILAVIGAGIGLSRKKRPAAWRSWLDSWPLWFALWTLLVLAGLISFAMRTPAMQGRLLFPAILPLALGLAYGLDVLAGRQPAARLLINLTPGVPFAASLTALFFTLPATFNPPILMSDDPLLQETALVFDDLLTLTGVSLPPSIPAESSYYPALFAWQAQESTSANVIEFVQLVTPDGERFAGVDTFHGGGLYPTSLWPPGETIRETVYLDLPAHDPTDPDGCYPKGLGIDVGLYTASGPLLTQHGQATARLGTVRLAPTAGSDVNCRSPLPQNDPFFLGEPIALTGYVLSESTATPGQTIILDVVWETRSRPATDYTVFLHLLAADGEIAVQFDRPPLHGTLPTRLWESGDIVPDTHDLPLPTDLPPGTYTLVAGWYDPADFSRLPAVDAQTGGRFENDAVPLGQIEVSP